MKRSAEISNILSAHSARGRLRGWTSLIPQRAKELCKCRPSRKGIPTPSGRAFLLPQSFSGKIMGNPDTEFITMTSLTIIPKPLGDSVHRRRKGRGRGLKKGEETNKLTPLEGIWHFSLPTPSLVLN